jgi:hypothetical protein
LTEEAPAPVPVSNADNNSRHYRADEVQVVGGRTSSHGVLHFGRGDSNFPLVILDLLLGNRPQQPQAPPLDLSGGYWVRRRKGQLTKDDVGLEEQLPKDKSGAEGTLPGKDCPICLSPISDITAAVCGHVFCEECILQAIHHQGKCPKCRRVLTAKDIHPLFL